MYICLCHRITDGAVREAARDGAASAKEVFARLGLRPDCGTCTCHVGTLLRGDPGVAGRAE